MLSRSVALCLMAMAVSTSALAGDLNPPAGAVAPTGRFGPRTEINAINTPGDANSLFRITAPGSYYLGGNILGVVGKHAIEIAASGVTLDLMGFDLRDVPSSLDGVRVSVVAENVHIRNGSLRAWGGDDMQEVVV